MKAVTLRRCFLTELKENFFWGNSTSSIQTEGAWDTDGKGKSVYDIQSSTDNASDWKNAIDEYHRYEEDFDLMQNQGINFYRFQISWSRVNPTGDGKFSERGMAFYSRLIDALLIRGIQPMICLYHFDMPLALAEKYNGFLSRHVIDAFIRYGTEVIKRFSNKVKYWITFNEQNLYHTSDVFRISGYLKGPRTNDELYQISHHIMLAHAGIANYIHEQTNCLIGGMLAYAEIYPASPKPEDIQIARKTDEFINRNLLDAFVYGHYSNEVLTYLRNHDINMDWQVVDKKILSKLHSDYIAFSYYRSETISAEQVPQDIIPNYYVDYGIKKNPYLKTSEWGWDIDPLGFQDVLVKIYNEYGIPVFPIENGIGVHEKFAGSEIQDDYRIEYHRSHINAMKNAIKFNGVDVLGYLVWGLIDIPSSSGNMDKRYGMVYVNRDNHDLKDMRRVTKKSYWWFRKVIKTNGEDLTDVLEN
ncbi:glycoside hydrolase family 1 protein [Oenococcus sp. UCMA 17063]|nr:glycoside hydrolase family 1 protein [Oenococcus sp. UCMA 17063]